MLKEGGIIEGKKVGEVQQRSADRIKKVLDEEIKLLGNSRKLCIGGFSQGGVMALRVGLEYDQPLGGIFCYSGWYSPFTIQSTSNLTTPIFLQFSMTKKSTKYLTWLFASKTYTKLNTR